MAGLYYSACASAISVRLIPSRQVGTQMIWTAFTVLGEVFCSVSVLGFMLKRNVSL
jgi:hypothetical protein